MSGGGARCAAERAGRTVLKNVETLEVSHFDRSPLKSVGKNPSASPPPLMSVICETSQSSIWASQQLLLLTHSTTSVFSVALSVNTIASASGVAIARRSGWLRIACAELFPAPRDLLV